MRDILSSTKNSMDYDLISTALQNLWDDQLVGNRSRPRPSFSYHGNYVSEMNDNDLYYQDGSGYEWYEEDDWWDEQPQAYFTDAESYEEQWWQDEWHGQETTGQANAVTPDPADEEKLRDAMQAEQLAETLALEAQRTWSEAQRATQALKRDRGFGAPPSTGMKCFSCGGPHLLRDCPRRAGGYNKGKSKGKSKYGYMTDMDAHYLKGKSKGKGKPKGKQGMYFNADAAWKGKGKGKHHDSSQRTVNAYASDFFAGGLELTSTLEATATVTTEPTPELGMVDCGATASAAPEAVVKGLIASILEKDRGARVDIDANARPYFRFGDGRWGRALYRVRIASALSGVIRSFSLYALPNPKEYFQAGFDKASLVPILIGMDFLGKDANGLIIDFTTGLATSSLDDRPEIFQLQRNRKGHFMLDIREYITRGHVNLEGHAHVVVSSSNSTLSQSEAHVIEFHVVQFDLTVSDMASIPQQILAQCSRQLSRLKPRQLPLLALCPMATSSTTIDKETAEILAAAAKAKAAPKKRAKSLDMARTMKSDPRDPRGNARCWPCYGQHQPGPAQANQHGQWVHCKVCDLRLLYTPRKGAPSNTTMVHNPAMVKKMLTQLKALLGDHKPTAKVCLHMFNKITAEEVLETSIREIVNTS
ncbi:unnamed protein product, partial [Symbiodinium necroappetens]